MVHRLFFWDEMWSRDLGQANFRVPDMNTDIQVGIRVMCACQCYE